MFSLNFATPDAIELLILALACWRISNMLVYETGPFYIFTRMREWRGIAHDKEGYPVGYPLEKNLLLSCIMCTSVWVSTTLIIVYLVAPAISILVALPFALSAVACLIRHFVG